MRARLHAATDAGMVTVCYSKVLHEPRELGVSGEIR